jgi:hypothetical protein
LKSPDRGGGNDGAAKVGMIAACASGRRRRPSRRRDAAGTDRRGLLPLRRPAEARGKLASEQASK